MTHKLKSLKSLKSLKDIKPAPYNPREISQEAAKGLSASIAQFGDISGIVWNRRSGHVVAGHQRLAALQERGATFQDDPPRIVLGKESFTIRVVSWDDVTEKAANIAANNPHTSGDFVQDDLQGVLDSIQPDLPEFEELRLDLLAGEAIIERDGDKKSGASPWDRMKGCDLSQSNVSIGNIAAKIPALYVEMLEKIIEEFAGDWRESIEEVLKKWALQL